MRYGVSNSDASGLLDSRLQTPRATSQDIHMITRILHLNILNKIRLDINSAVKSIKILLYKEIFTYESAVGLIHYSGGLLFTVYYSLVNYLYALVCLCMIFPQEKKNVYHLPHREVVAVRGRMSKHRMRLSHLPPLHPAASQHGHARTRDLPATARRAHGNPALPRKGGDLKTKVAFHLVGGKRLSANLRQAWHVA